MIAGRRRAGGTNMQASDFLNPKGLGSRRVERRATARHSLGRGTVRLGLLGALIWPEGAG